MNRVADLQLTAGVRRDLRRAAEAAYPLEACGALLGAGARVTDIRPLPNRSSEADRSYEISPSDLEPLLRDDVSGGPSVIGFYHSHPDADTQPSSRDQELAWPDYWYLIVGVDDGVATSHSSWRLPHA